jgi:hypothetical protein
MEREDEGGRIWEWRAPEPPDGTGGGGASGEDDGVERGAADAQAPDLRLRPIGSPRRPRPSFALVRRRTIVG